jgi:hypothetical protein
MRRVLIMAIDANGNPAQYALDLNDTVTWAQVQAFAALIQAVTAPGIQQYGLMTNIANPNTAAVQQPTGLVTDLAKMGFKGADGSYVSISLCGAFGCYNADGITINPNNGSIAAIIAWALLHMETNSGSQVSSYQNGFRMV